MTLKRNRSKGKYWYDDIKPNGTKYSIYRRNIIHPDGVSRPVQAKGHQAWQLKCVQLFIDGKSDAAAKDHKKGTFAEMFPRYLKSVEEKRAVGTYVTIKGLFDRHILPRFKRQVISRTLTEELQEFADTLTKERGALVTKEVFKVLSPFMKWCKKQNCFDKNPISDDLLDTIRSNHREALKIKKKRENEYPLSTRDIERMFHNNKGSSDDIVYHFMGHTMRLGEALGVKVKDVNIFNKTVTLNHQVQSYSKQQLAGTRYIDDDGFNENSSTVVLDHLKTDESHRTIQLISETAELVTILIAGLKPDDLIFTTRNGTPCTPNNFRKRHWKPLLVKLGVDHKIKLTPHVMRGYVFSKGVAAGQDSALLSKALGHTSISTTLKSYFPDIEDDNQVNPLEYMSGVISKNDNIESVDADTSIASEAS